MTANAARPDAGAWARYAAGLLIACAVYAAAGWFGLKAASFGNITLVWPATGWSLAVLLLWGRHYWPGIFFGAFFLEATILPVWTSAGIALGNTLAPLAGAWALERLGFRPTFTHRRDAVQFLGLGVVGSMVISALNGPFWLILAEKFPPSAYPKAVFFWWLGDATGVLVFAPVLFPILRAHHPKIRPGSLAQSVAIIALNGVASTVAFLQMTPGERTLPTAFFPLLTLTITSIAFRNWVVSGSVLAVSLIAIYGTAHGTSAFSGFSELETAGLLWAFFAAIGISTLVIASLQGEQQTARKALGVREAQYRALVEDNPAMIVRFDPDGRLTFANETFCRFHELPAEALFRRNVFELIRGPEAERTRQEARRILGGPGPYVLLTHVVDPRGQERWIDWKAHLIEGGEFHAVGLEVTGRQVAESERRRLEQQVFQSQKWESLGLIAGGLAHDFNNMLMGILGHTDMAAALLPLHSVERGHLEKVAEAARRLAELNSQLLAFAGKGKLLDRRIDLNDLIVRTTRSLGAEHRIELDLDDALPDVMGDENQLGQVIRNLALNALEAESAPANTLAIRTRARTLEAGEFADCVTGQPAPAGYSVRLTVADTAGGIDAERLGRIFDPFFTTKSLGRGLGLPAVHGIVSAHGGAVLADSEPGRGTTITVFLPAVAAMETVPETAFPTAAAIPQSDRRRSVLVIDDEDSVRMLVAQMLQKFGWEVLSADGGLKGIAAYRGNADRIAFAVLDIMMPDMDGLAVEAAIREIRPGVPILFCTGYSTEALTLEENSGPSGLLRKPFSLGEFEAAIAQLLERSAGAAEVR